jgi:coenzyme F420-reducing hydrogenase delta subunit
MAAKVKKPPVTQYSVAVRATFLGCSALVSATSIEEARMKAKEGIFLDGIDMKSGELVDWEIQSLGYFTPYASVDK